MVLPKLRPVDVTVSLYIFVEHSIHVGQGEPMSPCAFSRRVAIFIFLGAAVLWITSIPAGAQVLKSEDLPHFRSVGDVELSPDGRYIAYTVVMRDWPGRPYPQVWVLDVASGKSKRIGGDQKREGSPIWSPDGKWLAYLGGEGDQSGLHIVRPDGNGDVFLALVPGSNSPLPGQGETICWSPDGKQIAFVSATPGPETAEVNGDPMVITRYLYKPTASEGLKRFNDNRRLHISIVSLDTHQTRALTSGNFDEHSIDWSPDGTEILFVSNREPNADEFFNYDIFALKIADGSIRRLTTTESNEYAPRWSPDGKHVAYSATRRGLTDRETNMEDTHVWIMDSDGSNRREIGAVIDNRQGHPQWSPDGSAVYFTVQVRGSVHLTRLPISGGGPQSVISDLGVVGSWSVGAGGALAYAFASPSDMPELYFKPYDGSAKQLTALNAEILHGKQLGEVESLYFQSNDHKFEIEAFLTKPVNLAPKSTHPLIVSLHGGPHGQSGPAFNFKNQVYAGLGWAVLQVNYRGSTGYGQKFADAVFRDQDGDEAQDVLYAVSAVVRRNLWIDRERMGIEGGSYGGQLTEWLITQTNEFKAAIPLAGISNLISYNYTTYYNQYEEMEFGEFLHQDDLMNLAWQRSPLRHVAAVHTPTLILHGENDNDVPISEAEQFFIALKDVGVDTVFVRYRREGHGLAEIPHIVDSIDRSIAWYEKHFPAPGAASTTNVQP